MSEKIPTAEFYDERFYLINKNGVEHYIASVTTKLGIESIPFLYRWYGELGFEQARKKLREAGDRGVRVHEAWYIYLMGGIVCYNPFNRPNFSDDQIKNYSTAANGMISVLSDQTEMVALWKLQRFFEGTKAKIIDLEMNVYSIEDDIAGTLDNAFYFEPGAYDVNGSGGLIIPEAGVYICDLKSGNAVSESAWAQIAAYARAYESMGKGKPKGGIVLHTSASTKKGIPGFSALLKTAKQLEPHYEIYQHLSAVWTARNPNAGPVAFQFPTIISRKTETAPA